MAHKKQKAEAQAADAAAATSAPEQTDQKSDQQVAE